MTKNLGRSMVFAALLAGSPGAFAAPALPAMDFELVRFESEVEEIEREVGEPPEEGSPASVQSLLGGADPGRLTPVQSRKLKRIVRLLGRIQRLALRPLTGPRAHRMARLLLRIQRIALRMAIDPPLGASVSDRRGPVVPVVAVSEPAAGDGSSSGEGR